jgi:hypothetical protein
MTIDEHWYNPAPAMILHTCREAKNLQVLIQKFRVVAFAKACDTGISRKNLCVHLRRQLVLLPKRKREEGRVPHVTTEGGVSAVCFSKCPAIHDVLTAGLQSGQGHTISWQRPKRLVELVLSFWPF